MRNRIAYLTSALCVGFAAALVMVLLKLGDAQSKIKHLEAEVRRLQDFIEGDGVYKDFGTVPVDVIKAEIEKRNAAEAQVAELVAALESAQSKLAKVLKAEEVPESEEDGHDATPPFLRMFEDDEAIVASAKMQVGMQYGMLLADLKLPAEVEDEVREILAGSIAEQLRKTMKAMQDGTMKDFRANQSDEAVTEALRTELSTVLNAEEMAIWEDYEANKGYYMLEQSYDMQLGMYAPTMSRETRDTVKQVLAEEMTVSQQDQPNSGDSNPNDWVATQSDAMNRGLERLSTVLTEDEYAQVERFIEQQNENLRASQRMMQSMMGNDGDDGSDS